MASPDKPAQTAYTSRAGPVYYAIGANLALVVGWGLTASGTMLAEGLHSIADTGNQDLLLLGLRQGKKRHRCAIR